jgi:hypothetical protein
MSHAPCRPCPAVVGSELLLLPILAARPAHSHSPFPSCSTFPSRGMLIDATPALCHGRLPVLPQLRPLHRRRSQPPLHRPPPSSLPVLLRLAAAQLRVTPSRLATAQLHAGFATTAGPSCLHARARELMEEMTGKQERSGFIWYARFRGTKPTRIWRGYSPLDEPNPDDLQTKRGSNWIEPVPIQLDPATKHMLRW